MYCAILKSINKTVVLIILNLLFIDCTNKKNDPLEDPLLLQNLLFYVKLKNPPILSDNQDGTVTLSTAYSFDGRIGKKYLLKKCLQGQMYRISTNDCQGIGGMEDQYGAVAFKYCIKNDISCNIRFIDDSTDSSQIASPTTKVEYYLTEDGKSDAFISCKSDGMEVVPPEIFYELYRTGNFKSTFSHTISGDLELWTQNWYYRRSTSFYYNQETGLNISKAVYMIPANWEKDKASEEVRYDFKVTDKYILCGKSMN